MPELSPLWVEYPAADPAAGSVIVERVTPEDVDYRFAQGVVRVVRDSYAEQFGDKQIPRGSVMEALDPDDTAAVAERQRVIHERVSDGAAHYWVTKDSEGDITGLSKILPGPPSVYLGDVIVAPPWKNGLGSKLLHAPFKFGGFPMQTAVELDGFEGSSVNAWYYKLGFRPTGRYDHFFIGERSMLIQRAVVPATIGLNGIVRTLERSKPALSLAVVHTTRP